MISDRQQEFIDIARSWLGTPWKHNQMVKGLGVDCVNFVYAVGREARVCEKMETRHRRVAIYNDIVRYMDKQYTAIDKHRIQPADIVCIKYRGINNHVAIVTDKGIIHADSNEGRVLEHPLDDRHKRKIVAAWRVF